MAEKIDSQTKRSSVIFKRFLGDSVTTASGQETKLTEEQATEATRLFFTPMDEWPEALQSEYLDNGRVRISLDYAADKIMRYVVNKP